MCGIAGYVLRAARSRRAAVLRDALCRMAHRGPDDEGLAFFDPPAGRVWNFVTEQSDPRVAGAARLAGDEAFAHRAAFGHRRFSIVGLDARGHQPMWTADGAVCASVNGEIYNYLELREELSELGHVFRSASDSEVLAVAYRAWGTEAFARTMASAVEGPAMPAGSRRAPIPHMAWMMVVVGRLAPTLPHRLGQAART